MDRVLADMRDKAPEEAEESGRLAIRIREELARRRMSRQALADSARISISTLEKALSGQRSFTLATLISIENALGIPLRSVSSTRAPAGQMACASLGSYTRAATGWLEGEYLTIRPGFNDPAAVYSYVTRIWWDETANSLAFRESARTDTQFEQGGQVSMPFLSSQVYLVTNTDGQYRLITLGRSTSDGSLNGVLSTLYVGEGTQLVPIACPITLRRLAAGETPQVGLRRVGEAGHAELRALLDKTVSHGFARLHP